jgi:hypothetical protein
MTIEENSNYLKKIVYIQYFKMQSNTRRERMLVANEKDKKDNEGKSDDRQPEKETVTTAE